MSATNDGGPAFPCSWEQDKTGNGMTLRDYFAAAALQGICAKHGITLRMESCNTGTHDKEAAYQAYRYADAMLAERARKEAQP